MDAVERASSSTFNGKRIPVGFRLRKNEAVAHAFTRLLGNQVEAASDCLRSKRRISDERVHESRKHNKRARAALRLFRCSLPRARFERINVTLRDAAHPLTEIRDTKVLLDTLASLREDIGDAANHTSMNALRRELETARAKTRRTLGASSAALAKTRRALRTVAKDVDEARVHGQGWDVLGPALRRMYRRARNALEAACSERSDEHLHETRKRVKQLWHALQILEPLRPAALGELIDEAHKVADLLGDDHDLAVLAQRASERELAARKDGQALLALILVRRQALQERALTLGERLLSEKPKPFEARLRKFWDRWQREDSNGLVDSRAARNS
jgi:CHAD domain-containing protein